MKLLVLCVVLCLGVAAFARPEGEASPVANTTPAEGEAAAVPKPSEQNQSEEEEAARRKRWYYYYPNFPQSFGYGYPWGFDYFPRGNNFDSSVSGRTGSTPYTASFEELLDHQRRNDFAHNQFQWMNNQRFNPDFNRNIPDVIDTASHQDAAVAESRTRFGPGSNNFNPNFNGDFNPNFNPNFNSNFNPNPNFFPNPNFYP